LQIIQNVRRCSCKIEHGHAPSDAPLACGAARFLPSPALRLVSAKPHSASRVPHPEQTFSTAGCVQFGSPPPPISLILRMMFARKVCNFSASCSRRIDARAFSRRQSLPLLGNARQILLGYRETDRTDRCRFRHRRVRAPAKITPTIPGRNQHIPVRQAGLGMIKPFRGYP
jgi:hypothetical protein